MNRPTSTVISLQEDVDNAVGLQSFDTELSLLESTLIDTKNEPNRPTFKIDSVGLPRSGYTDALNALISDKQLPASIDSKLNDIATINNNINCIIDDSPKSDSLLSHNMVDQHKPTHIGSDFNSKMSSELCCSSYDVEKSIIKPSLSCDIEMSNLNFNKSSQVTNKHSSKSETIVSVCDSSIEESNNFTSTINKIPIMIEKEVTDKIDTLCSSKVEESVISTLNDSIKNVTDVEPAVTDIPVSLRLNINRVEEDPEFTQNGVSEVKKVTPEAIQISPNSSQNMQREFNIPIANLSTVESNKSKPTYFLLQKDEQSNIDHEVLNKQEQDGAFLEKLSEIPVCFHSTPLRKSENPVGTKPACSIKLRKEEDDSMDVNNPSNIYCSSTPVLLNNEFENSKTTLKSDLINLGEITPVNIMPRSQVRNNLKRKFPNLECIEEVDENDSDIFHEKKFKYGTKEDNDIGPSCMNVLNENDVGRTSSSVACFETPAKSILKKWQTSIGTSSRTSFYILDEWEDNEVNEDKEEIKKGEDDDTFEDAFDSLNEELIKSSSNIALEKYYSKLQLESQIDGENFDKWIQEMNYNLGDETSLSVVPMEESLGTSLPCISSGGQEPTKAAPLSGDQLECHTDGDVQINPDIINNGSNNSEKLLPEIKVSCSKNEIEGPHTSKSISGQSTNTQIPIVDLAGQDEEDLLLEGDFNSKALKPYEFQEFISSDPQENEDNYNPEWKRLGQLTNDEERYKAVRDRWLSIIPPDPNKDLTCRQWRERNGKPPLKLRSSNNNYRLNVDEERTQPCTAVFNEKIKKIIEESENKREMILRDRNFAFEKLARVQDMEQERCLQQRGNVYHMQRQHIEECQRLKEKYDNKIKNLTRATEDKKRVLSDAIDEVVLFQKFYKGYNNKYEKVCLYLTDTQFQEQQEIEEMVERYPSFYTDTY